MGKHFKNKKRKSIILSILRIFFIIVFISSSIYIVKWYIDGKQNNILKEKTAEAIIIEESEEDIDVKYKIDFEKLKNINNQVVAWIKVYGTQVEYPVVQAEDNSYYLKHNLEKKYNVAGWIFADYKNKLDGTDKNIVIYGHNMRDSAMFGSLKAILTKEWYDNTENYIIDYFTENEQEKYQVFSVYEIETEEYYIKTEFKENEFEEFVTTIKNRSIKNFNVDITADSNILTLSTCADDNRYRIVLHAVKLNRNF